MADGNEPVSSGSDEGFFLGSINAALAAVGVAVEPTGPAVQATAAKSAPVRDPWADPSAAPPEHSREEVVAAKSVIAPVVRKGLWALDGLEDAVRDMIPGLSTNSDRDGDGSSDNLKATIGSNPHTSDSDDDRFVDSAEVMFGEDPANRDSDFDGLSDDDEVELDLNPWSSDTDGTGSADFPEEGGCFGDIENDPVPEAGRADENPPLVYVAIPQPLRISASTVTRRSLRRSTTTPPRPLVPATCTPDGRSRRNAAWIGCVV
jgi:hypothetical protein